MPRDGRRVAEETDECPQESVSRPSVRLSTPAKAPFTSGKKPDSPIMAADIAKGKASSDPHVVKMATFAANAKKWP